MVIFAARAQRCLATCRSPDALTELPAELLALRPGSQAPGRPRVVLRLPCDPRHSRLIHNATTRWRCDIKTLAREAGVDRTAFYGTRPYAALRVEFEQRLGALQQAGEIPDPRDAQIVWRKREVGTLKQRAAKQDQAIRELTDSRSVALSRLAAQHDEVTCLRAALAGPRNVRGLQAKPTTIGPCS
jgi:hypothetical protein